MANTGFKGIDIVQSGSQIVFRVSLKDSSGAKLTTGTTTLTLYELQSDGTLASYDFSSNTFKTTALTTATLALTHRTGNNGTTNTGLWTVALATLTGFTVGGIYIAQVNNTGAAPPDQEREFQYAGVEGDVVVTAGATGLAYPQTDTKLWLTAAPLALSSQQVQAIVNAYATGQAPLQPSTAGRTLDVSATGEAGLDFDNIKDASSPHTLTNITVPNLTNAPTVGDLTAAMKASVTAAVPTAAAIVTAIQSAVVEGTITKVQADRIILSACAGKASGLNLNLPKYRDTTDTKNRIDATTDNFGNRLTVTLDGT